MGETVVRTTNTTFSSNDITRIMRDHLTNQERNEVVCAILIGTRRLGGYASGLSLLRAILSLIAPIPLRDLILFIRDLIAQSNETVYDADF